MITSEMGLAQGCVVNKSGFDCVRYFFSNGEASGDTAFNVKAPWREKLRWEGEIEWKCPLNELGPVFPAGNVDFSMEIGKFIGKKTRMTLEEL